jgi:hypothetical protein
MNDIDPENLSAAITAPDRAFLDSEAITFQGEELAPFSPPRQIAAQALGNRILSGRIAREQDGLYDGMFFDVICLLYLCRGPKSEVLLATRKPEKISDKAMEWADSAGISVGSEAFAEACEVYGRIFASLEAAQFRIKETRTPGNEPKNA